MNSMIEACPACGADRSVHLAAKPGRFLPYHGLELEVPEDLEVPECESCGERFWGPKELDAVEVALDAAYRAEMQRRAIELLAKLEAANISQRRLERVLQLSQGYLSKIRSKETPSVALLSELVLIAEEPEARLASLERFWSTPNRAKGRAKASA